MLDPQLLKLLCCPETYQPLQLADSALIEQLNQKVRAGKATNRAGRTISEPLTAGLVRADGKLVYPIRKQIPVLLIDEGISLK
jgi:uncharacterized protein YbaR (Trm112 family)